MGRPDIDLVMMATATLWARRSTCSSRISVGAVIATLDGRVIATGYNGSPSGQPHCDDKGCVLDSDGHCIRSIHAEENAILQCARLGVSCEGMAMYVTHSPCPNCCKRIIQVGISEVHYHTPYKGVDVMLKELVESHILVRPTQYKEHLNELLRSLC